MTATELAATAEIDQVPVGLGMAKEYRATLRGGGGSAALGYGATEDEARASLARTIQFNLDHNGAAI
ncbi:hypothetical protein SEA_ZENTENO07_88 [Mycobacterium phage Zenteno07]|nr:hypothetical protein SEA_ZENTENO07_88 [Mycobacterium phage Zenteno07]